MRQPASEADDGWETLPSAPPPHQAPRRVVDGMISSLAKRPVWSVASGRLAARGILDDVCALIAGHGKRLVALADGAHPTGPAPVGTGPTVEQVAVDSLGDLAAACGCRAFDIVHVGTDPEADALAALRLGFGSLLITDGRFTCRGVLTVRTPAQLRDVLDGRADVRSTSTYHEV